MRRSQSAADGVAGCDYSLTRPPKRTNGRTAFGHAFSGFIRGRGLRASHRLQDCSEAGGSAAVTRRKPMSEVWAHRIGARTSRAPRAAHCPHQLLSPLSHNLRACALNRPVRHGRIRIARHRFTVTVRWPAGQTGFEREGVRSWYGIPVVGSKKKKKVFRGPTPTGAHPQRTKRLHRPTLRSPARISRSLPPTRRASAPRLPHPEQQRSSSSMHP